MFVWFCLLVSASVCLVFTGGQMMTGQPQEVSVNSSRVLTAAQFAVVEFNKANTEDQFEYKIVNITSAKVQVVAGINYILDVKLGPTVCKSDSVLCVKDSEPKELQCHFIVTEIPWRDRKRTLTQKKCHKNTP